MKNTNTSAHIRFLSGVLFFIVSTIAAVYVAKTYDYSHLSFKEGTIVNIEGNDFPLQAIDFTPDPGEFTSFKDIDSFFSRQDVLSEYLKKEHSSSSLGDLTAVFWMQIIVGAFSLLLSFWIWSLVPEKYEAKMFALSGIGLCVSAQASAIYTTRALAIPSSIFVPLFWINAYGAVLFGAAMTALFIHYPIKIKVARGLSNFILIGSTVWFMAFMLRLTPAEGNTNLMILVLMLTIISSVIMQFFLSKRDAKSRAILIWLGLAVVVGSGFFVFSNSVPLIFGMEPLHQGYAFLSFILIYIGVAAGIKQYRLFEVGEWGFKFLFYGLGTIVFLILDFSLIYMTQLDRYPALTISLTAVCFIYLPLREQIRRFFLSRKEVPTEDVLGQTLNVAFATTKLSRQNEWKNFLQSYFKVLELKEIDTDTGIIDLKDSGTELVIPGFLNLSPLRLRYPWGGKTLFSPKDVNFINRIMNFIKELDKGLEAYERGMREERLRLAKELHDDLGSKLLTGLYKADDETRPIFENAIQEMREIVSEMKKLNTPLLDIMAEIRFESMQRLDAYALNVTWPINSVPEEIQLSAKDTKHLRSIIRELVSNLLKHSKCKSVQFNLIPNNTGFVFNINHDGLEFYLDQSIHSEGNGIPNILERMRQVKGRVEFNGQSVSIHWPVVSDQS